MFNKEETISILLSALVLAFAISLFDLSNLFLIFLVYILIIILGNTFFKKATANYLDIKMNVKLWEIKQWGYKPHLRFKKGFPLGLILAIIIKIISLGYADWTAALTFDVKPKTYRAAKRHGLYAYTEISETQIGVIAAVGIGSTLLFALFGYILGYPDFAKLALGYAFFNMLPFSNLDGNKIFFGSKTLWIFLETIVLIGVLVAIFAI